MVGVSAVTPPAATQQPTDVGPPSQSGQEEGWRTVPQARHAEAHDPRAYRVRPGSSSRQQDLATRLTTAEPHTGWHFAAKRNSTSVPGE